MQTIILFITSTSPYFALENKLVLKVLQEHYDVFKDIESQRFQQKTGLVDIALEQVKLTSDQTLGITNI